MAYSLWKGMAAALCVAAAGAEAATLIEDDFVTFDRFRPACIGETVVMKAEPDTLVLGGKSDSGERAGLVYSGFHIRDWELQADGLGWTHDTPIGGHPTEFMLLDDAGRGYGVRLAGTAMSLFRQDGPGERTDLAASGGLWDGGSGYTESYQLSFKRLSDGTLEAVLSDFPALRAGDDRYDDFSRLAVEYEVYIHGYGALLDAVRLTSSTDGRPPMTPPPFSLAGGATLIDDRFVNLDGVTAVCEKDTMIMQFRPGQLILGGPGADGDRAGVTIGGFTVSDWALALENLAWSHENADGGHPTEVVLSDDAGHGYGFRIAGGMATLFRQDGEGSRVTLASSPQLFSPGDGATVPRRVIFARGGDDELYFAMEGLPDSVLNARDGRWRELNTLHYSYEVYRHGYGCEINGLFLKSLETDAEVAAPATETLGGRRIAVLDAEALLPEIRRFGTAERIKSSLTAAGAELRDEVDTADLLIVPAVTVSAADLRTIDRFARSGKPLFILGTSDWKNGLADADPATRALLHRFYERIFGNGRPPVKTALEDGGAVTLTPAGQQILGAEFAGFRVPQAQVLPLTNSTEKQSLPLWVEREDLMSVVSREGNWIQMKDDFVSSVAQLQRHRAGEYAGARIFLSGLPLDGASPLNPSNPRFSDLIARVLTALEQPVEPADSGLADVLSGNPPLTRAGFLDYPAQVFGTLCFGDFSYLDDDEIFVEDLNMGGFNVVCYCVPWLREPAADGEVVDWERLDWMLQECRRIGKKLMLDPYPETFDWRHYSWRREMAGYDPAFAEPYLDALGKIARRYKDDDTLVAMWCTAYTGDVSLPDWDKAGTPAVRAMWQAYLRDRKGYSLAALNDRYGTDYRDWSEVGFPEAAEELPYNLGPAWSDAIEFHIDAFQNYMRRCIETIRAEIPDMPLTTRGNYVDVAISMAVAAEYPDVAVHSECVETTYDTEGYFRSMGRGFDIPITAENGWPKALPAAMKMALADYLMGDYRALTYSFAGPRWARDVYGDFTRTAAIRTQMNRDRAHYAAEADLGILIGDTTLYASRPPVFFSIEGLPHLQSALEKSGFHFIGVSAQIPRFNDLKVLVDDGTNFVMTAEFRDALSEWIEAGGIFITFPESGRYSLDGGVSFRERMELPAAAGRYERGRGAVILLDAVEAGDPAGLAALLKNLGVGRDFEMTPMVTNATLTSPDGSVRYLVLFDKSPTLVGSFFTESGHDRTLARLPDRELTIRPNFPAARAVELMTGEELPLKDGAVTLILPAAELRVIEFR